MHGQSNLQTSLEMLRKPVQGFKGVLVPALTPFKGDLSPDAGGHARLLPLASGAGRGRARRLRDDQRGEFALALAERTAWSNGSIEGGIPAARLMPGTGACNIPEAVQMTRHAVASGAGGVLVLPPFYYKNVSDDGVFAYYAEVIERVGDKALRLYLYHFPALSGVSLSPALVSRLAAAYGPVIAGLKDSSGSWELAALYIKEFPAISRSSRPRSGSCSRGSRRAGRAASAPRPITRSAISGGSSMRSEGEARRELNEAVARVRGLFEKLPLIPALKAAMAIRFKREAWRVVRPPLVELSEVQRRDLASGLDAVGA